MTLDTWEEIADSIARAGWSWGCARALLDGRLRWIADATRESHPRYVAQADTKLQAFDTLRSTLPAVAARFP